MGRWAQRSQRGGGPPTGTVQTVQMSTAQLTAPDELTVQYTGSVNATAFLTTDFEADPGDGQQPIAIAQGAADTAILTFGAPLVADDTLNYSGAAANVLTPDSIAIT